MENKLSSIFFYDPSKESINTATTFECSLEGEKLRVKNSSVNCLFSNLDSKQFDESYNNFFKHLNLDFSPIKSGNKTYQLSEKEQNALIQVLITNWIYYYTINDLPIVVKKADFESPSMVDQVLFVLDKKYGRNTPVSLSLGAKILRQQEKDYRTTVKARRRYYDR